MSRLLKKLRVSSRAQVLPWVLALGLADLPASAPAPGSPSDGVRQ